MPQPSRRVRALRRKKQTSKQEARQKASTERLQKMLIGLAMKYESEAVKADRLSKLLSAIVAIEGGVFAIDQKIFDALPKGIHLFEEYEPATDQILLRTAAPKSEIEAVRPSGLVDVSGNPLASEKATPENNA